MNSYKFIDLFQKYGSVISLVAAVALCVGGILIVNGIWVREVLVAFVVLGAFGVWVLLRTFTDIVTILSETLIPKL